MTWQELNELILTAVGGSEEFAKTWWNSQNYMFDMKTPMQEWEVNSERVVQYLKAMLVGSYGDFS